MEIAKSIGSVVAGFIAIVLLAGVTDTVMESVGAYPTDREGYTTWMFLVSIAYRTVYSAIGGFVVGKLAPRRPMYHVTVLAIIGTLIGVAGVVAGWNLPGYPHWYAITLAVLTFPSIWFGGKMALPKPTPETDT